MVKDPAKVTCQVGGCRNVSDTKTEWKFGKGVAIPFGEGVCTAPVGKHHVMLLCATHRKQALEMDPRPYRMTLTAWARNPDAHEAVAVVDGQLVLSESVS